MIGFFIILYGFGFLIFGAIWVLSYLEDKEWGTSYETTTYARLIPMTIIWPVGIIYWCVRNEIFDSMSEGFKDFWKDIRGNRG